MSKIAGLPFEWADFDKAGMLKSAPPPWCTDGSVSDVIVVAHGWKTDAEGADDLCKPLIGNIVKAWTAGKPPKPDARTFGVVGVLWPAKTFDASYEHPMDVDKGAQGGGGGLSAGRGGGVQDVDDATLNALIADYAAFVGADAAAVRQKAKAAIHGGLKTSDCQTLLRTVLEPLETSPSDPELKVDRAPYEIAKAKKVLEELSGPPMMPVSPGVGAAAGVGKFIGKILAGPNAAVARLLNQLTFYDMKTRAGKVGAGAATHVLKPIAQGQAERVHLVGHSFGARLVTAAAFGAGSVAKIRSLTMLQGAFSHNALSQANGGAFAGAYRNVAGATLITHTHNDGAVTLAYALASRLSRDNTRAIGDKDDTFGAIGANGALGLPAGDAAAAVSTGQLGLKPRKVCNLQCDDCIASHMDVTNEKVAALVAAAIAI